MKDFLEKISKEEIDGFYPTGSVYFGLDNEKSDMDFVVKKEVWRKINKRAFCFYGKKLNLIDDGFGGWNNYEYEFESIKFIYNNRLFNFIIVPDNKEYRIWVQTTKTFLLLLKNNVLKRIMKDKGNRIEIFELLKKQFREYYDNN